MCFLFYVGMDPTATERQMAKHATGQLFKMARFSNMLRHAKKGTLVSHLARKFLINKVLRKIGL